MRRLSRSERGEPCGNILVPLDQDRIHRQVGAETRHPVLMGDLVEPRREFIEVNALNVRNLDV